MLHKYTYYDQEQKERTGTPKQNIKSTFEAPAAACGTSSILLAKASHQKTSCDLSPTNTQTPDNRLPQRESPKHRDLAQASTRPPKASFSLKRATVTLRLRSHRHTRPVNCHLAKAHNHNTVTSHQHFTLLGVCIVVRHADHGDTLLNGYPGARVPGRPSTWPEKAGGHSGSKRTGGTPNDGIW